MENLAKIFIVFFICYLATLAIHFVYFVADHQKFDKKDEETPFHKYLKHSHVQWTNNTNAKRRQTIPRSYNLGDEKHARLTCSDGDGTEQDLVYWHKPTDYDDKWKSPWASETMSKYVIFESDNGGWNNVRMAFEAVFVFARATGRTIVMPPDEAFYFPDPGVEKKDFFKNHNGYADFFPLEEMKSRLGKEVVISMDEFLERECYNGNMGKLPPKPTTKEVNELTGETELKLRGHPLRDYLRSLANAKEEIIGGVGGGGCLKEGAFSETKTGGYYMPCFKDGGRKTILAFPHKGSELDVSKNQRLNEFAAGRDVVKFEGKWIDSKVIHFAAWPKAGYRILMHFYTILYFEDVSLDRRMKRFVRDHFRYHDNIWCAAARVLRLVKRDASLVNIDASSHLKPTEFSSYHVRHGEFQFKVVRLEAADILKNSEDLLKGELLYIATDEQDKDTFFKPMKEKYTLKFLDDYFKEAKLDGLPSNMLGMVDTIVASQGRVFVGTWFSTFSGYIIRVRGYHGLAPESYYFFLKKKFAMQSKELPSDPFYTREWPTAWENIDYDIEMAQGSQ